MDTLDGKVAVVTGGGSGIGRAMALSFAEGGAHCVIADVDDEAAERVAGEVAAKGVRAITAHADVADRAAVEGLAEKAFAELGGAHVLCNNAGVGLGGPLHEHTDDDWDWILGVNLRGVIHGVQTFVPRIIAQGQGGHVINTASMAGMIVAPYLGAYTVTKFAVVALSEALRQDLAPYGIGVSVLCPGFVRTRIHESQRNRPEAFGGPEAGQLDPELDALNRSLVEGGIDADVVGQRVARAILDNDPYIFTHPDMRPLVEARFRRILEAFDKAAALQGSDQQSPLEILKGLGMD